MFERRRKEIFEDTLFDDLSEEVRENIHPSDPMFEYRRTILEHELREKLEKVRAVVKAKYDDLFDDPTLILEVRFPKLPEGSRNSLRLPVVEIQFGKEPREDVLSPKSHLTHMMYPWSKQYRPKHKYVKIMTYAHFFHKGGRRVTHWVLACSCKEWFQSLETKEYPLGDCSHTRKYDERIWILHDLAFQMMGLTKDKPL